MVPKKATSASSKKATPAPHASYRDMIKDAIVNLKERNGSSRQAIKKYVTSNNKITFASQGAFDAQFNKAIKAGVEKGEFTQPKGPSGPLKLAKKEAAAKPAAKPAVKPAAKTNATKKTDTKAAATKKAAPKKTATKAATKTSAAKKTSSAKKSSAKPKANSGKARKTSTVAPAIVEQPKVIGKTKSGRVTKTTAPPAKPATTKRTSKTKK